MKIGYRSKKDEDLYQSEKALTAAFGSRMAKKIIQRIGELQSAPNPQLLPGNARFHEHNGKREGLFSLDLVHPFRLIVLPTCEYVSWVEIKSLQIFEVFNPH